MKASEFIIEHSNWAVNKKYTPEVMRELQMVCSAAAHASDQAIFKLRFTQHFFDQMKLQRGHFGMYTKDDLLMTLAKIVKRGLQFFKGKVPGKSYAFYDPATNIIIEIVRSDDSTCVARSTIRDTDWLGDSPMIRL